MPWVRVDDHFDEHPKMAAVGPVGWGVWLAGLAYCNRNLTDGFIPFAIAEGIGGSWHVWEPIAAEQELTNTLRQSDQGMRLWSIDIGSGMHGEHITTDWVVVQLLHAGLWVEVPGGYRIHDYEDYQPTKAQVIADRDAKAAAGRAGGRATAAARAAAPAKARAVAKVQPVPVPVPNVPNPAPVARAREGDADDGEMEVVAWLARHECALPETSGLRRKIVTLVERFGANAVIGKLDRLVDAGVMDGDARGFIFGAEDALFPKADLKALDREERADDEAAAFDRRVEQTQRQMRQVYGEEKR